MLTTLKNCEIVQINELLTFNINRWENMTTQHKYILMGAIGAVLLTRALVRGGLGSSAQIAYANLPVVGA